MRLLLVRHGAAAYWYWRVIGGSKGCSGLTAEGRTQAELLRDRLRLPGVLPESAVLLSSPWLRASETALILEPAFNGATVRHDKDLQEMDPGVSDGLPWDEHAARYGEFDMIAEPDRPFAPQGESWSMFAIRVRGFFDRVAQEFAGNTVVAVTHGGFIEASLLEMFSIPRPGTRARLMPLNAGITEWTFDDAWTLARYNDTGHLT